MEDYTDWEKIARHLKGESSEEEKKAFLNWLNEQEENQEKLADTKRIWEIAQLPAESYEPNIEKGWQRFQSKIKGQEQDSLKVILESVSSDSSEAKVGKAKPKGKVLALYSSLVFKVAAVVVVACGLGFIAFSNLFNRSIEVETAQKETKEIVLPDGSKVWLNTNSKISYSKDFDIENRFVNLSGEAFFEVKKAGGKTFTIFTSNSKTEVMGTEFNVRGYENESQVQVTVIEGKVSFSDKNSKARVFLLPGDKGLIKSDDSILKIKSENKNEVAWKTKELTFENTHLKDVLNTLEGYFDTQFIVNNKDILNCRFTGNFQNSELKEIMEVLAVSVDLKYQEKGNSYNLEGLGCR